MRKTLGLAALAAVLACGGANAQQVNVKIGVLSDMSSLYSDIGGAGSVAAAKLAIADFTKDQPECESRDYQLAIIRTSRTSVRRLANQWYDVDKVDMIIDMPNSGVALAVSKSRQQEQGIHCLWRSGVRPYRTRNATPTPFTGPTTPGCSPTAPARRLVKTGGDSWFFLTSDYAFGHALERDTAAAVEKAGGKVSARCVTL